MVTPYRWGRILKIWAVLVCAGLVLWGAAIVVMKGSHRYNGSLVATITPHFGIAEGNYPVNDVRMPTYYLYVDGELKIAHKPSYYWISISIPEIMVEAGAVHTVWVATSNGYESVKTDVAVDFMGDAHVLFEMGDVSTVTVIIEKQTNVYEWNPYEIFVDGDLRESGNFVHDAEYTLGLVKGGTYNITIVAAGVSMTRIVTIDAWNEELLFSFNVRGDSISDSIGQRQMMTSIPGIGGSHGW